MEAKAHAPEAINQRAQSGATHDGRRYTCSFALSHVRRSRTLNTCQPERLCENSRGQVPASTASQPERLYDRSRGQVAVRHSSQPEGLDDSSRGQAQRRPRIPEPPTIHSTLKGSQVAACVPAGRRELRPARRRPLHLQDRRDRRPLQGRGVISHPYPVAASASGGLATGYCRAGLQPAWAVVSICCARHATAAAERCPCRQHEQCRRSHVR